MRARIVKADEARAAQVAATECRQGAEPAGASSQNCRVRHRPDSTGPAEPAGP